MRIEYSTDQFHYTSAYNAVQVMLGFVDVLLLSQTDASKARAAEINAEVQELLTSDTAAVRDIETQVSFEVHIVK